MYNESKKVHSKDNHSYFVKTKKNILISALYMSYIELSSKVFNNNFFNFYFVIVMISQF